jgi:hypothetical protein
METDSGAVVLVTTVLCLGDPEGDCAERIEWRDRRCPICARQADAIGRCQIHGCAPSADGHYCIRCEKEHQ